MFCSKMYAAGVMLIKLRCISGAAYDLRGAERFVIFRKRSQLFNWLSQKQG